MNNNAIPDFNMDDFYAKIDEEERKKNAKTSTKVEFNDKNYLNTKLDKKGTLREKHLNVRILEHFDPDDTTNGMAPFREIYSHMTKMKDGSYKTYTCLNKTVGIESLGLGNKCPYCEMKEALLEEAKQIKDKDLNKEKYKEAMQYAPKKQYIVRVIDRNAEEDGPKFWRFNDSSEHQGVFDKLRTLYTMRSSNGSIFSTENGKDLDVQIVASPSKSRPGQFDSKIGVISDAESRSKLSPDEAKSDSWLRDAKKWYQVYPPKPYGYLEVAMFGDTPMFVKGRQNTWASKNEYDAIKQKGGEPYYDDEEQCWKDSSELVAKGGNDNATEDDSVVDNIFNNF